MGVYFIPLRRGGQRRDERAGCEEILFHARPLSENM